MLFLQQLFSKPFTWANHNRFFLFIESLDSIARFMVADFRYWYCGLPQYHPAIGNCRKVFFHEHGFHPAVVSLLTATGNADIDSEDFSVSTRRVAC